MAGRDASGTNGWTREAMYALGMRHATLEAEGDLAGPMEPLIAEPIYEFWPIGRRMVGSAAVERYYEHLIGTFMPLQIGYEMIGETLSELALSQEYMMEFPSDRGGSEKFRVMGILYGDPETPGKMGGERIWGDERILRHMVGPIWDELERMDA